MTRTVVSFHAHLEDEALLTGLEQASAGTRLHAVAERA